MNHEMYEALQGRLKLVRDTMDNLRRIDPRAAKVIVTTPAQGHYEGEAFVTDRPSVVRLEGEPGSLLRRLSEEAAGIIDLLVGEDPLVLTSVAWLAERYKDSDLVLRREYRSQMGEELGAVDIKLGGNEHWVFADVQIGDGYGVLDFEVHHAIWRNTGALYKVGRDGAVADDPIWVPQGSSYTGPRERYP